MKEFEMGRRKCEGRKFRNLCVWVITLKIERCHRSLIFIRHAWLIELLSDIDY